MLAGHRARRWCAQHKTLVYEKLCRTCPGFDKGETDVMLSWLCITLYLSLLEMCNLGYKSSFWKWSYRPGFIRAWSPRVILFFLFSPFLSLFFFQDDSLEHRGFIGFLCKPRKIKPLSLLFYLSLIADAILLRESLDPAGAGPRHTWIWANLGRSGKPGVLKSMSWTRFRDWTVNQSIVLFLYPWPQPRLSASGQLASPNPCPHGVRAWDFLGWCFFPTGHRKDPSKVNTFLNLFTKYSLHVFASSKTWVAIFFFLVTYTRISFNVISETALSCICLLYFRPMDPAVHGLSFQDVPMQLTWAST